MVVPLAGGQGRGWLLPLAYPVLGFLLLLSRGDHGPLQLEDTWRGGGMLLQMGTPTPSRDPNRGQNWEGVVYTSWWPNIPTPACPTGVMGAVIAVGSKAAGCHHVKPGWEGVQVHAWTWFLPSLFWGGLGAKLGSSPRPVSHCRSLWLSPGLKPLLSLHAQGGPPWPTSSWGILLQEMDNPGDGSPRVPPAP